MAWRPCAAEQHVCTDGTTPCGAQGNHPAAWLTAKANGCVNTLKRQPEPDAKPLKATSTDLETDLDHCGSRRPILQNAFWPYHGTADNQPTEVF